MVGDPDPSVRLKMSWCQARDEEVANRTPGKFTKIADNAQAVEYFKRLMSSGYHSTQLPELRGKNLACWCKPGHPCHADVLL